MVHGRPSGEHEPMSDVIHGWDKRLHEQAIQNPDRRREGRGELPSDTDAQFRYGLSTRELDEKADPLHRSNAIIEQRIAAQERKAQKGTPKADPPRKQMAPRSTAASRGHAKQAGEAPTPHAEFKMKRFAQIERGKIDTGNRRK
jgi:hypothetical protein